MTEEVYAQLLVDELSKISFSSDGQLQIATEPTTPTEISQAVADAFAKVSYEFVVEHMAEKSSVITANLGVGALADRPIGEAGDVYVTNDTNEIHTKNSAGTWDISTLFGNMLVIDEINTSLYNANIGNIGTSGSDKNYVHTQATALAVWTVSHPLEKKPSVTVVDTAGSVIIGDVQYIDDSNLTISFSVAFSGKAYLN